MPIKKACDSFGEGKVGGTVAGALRERAANAPQQPRINATCYSQPLPPRLASIAPFAQIASRPSCLFVFTLRRSYQITSPYSGGDLSRARARTSCCPRREVTRSRQCAAALTAVRLTPQRARMAPRAYRRSVRACRTYSGGDLSRARARRSCRLRREVTRVLRCVGGAPDGAQRLSRLSA